MPSLRLPPETAQELLELTDNADDLHMLVPHERRLLCDLGGLLRSVLLGVPR